MQVIKQQVSCDPVHAKFKIHENVYTHKEISEGYLIKCKPVIIAERSRFRIKVKMIFIFFD